MRRAGVVASVAAIAAGVALARPAEARLVDLHAGIVAGGIGGFGTDSHTPDFFAKTSGGAFGAAVGAKLLVFDLTVSFLQVANSSGWSGTLAQALLGFELDIPVGPDRFEDENGRKGRRKAILRPGFGAGVGFGTPGPVQTPYSESQISDKGIISQIKLGFEYNVHPMLGFGLEGDAGYHYFLGGAALNDVKDHSSGYHGMLLGTLTFHLGY